MLAESSHWLLALSTIAALVHLMGVINAVEAIMEPRSSEGAIAWAIALLLIPWVALPFYWVFGRSRFYGYVKARRSKNRQLKQIVKDMAIYSSSFKSPPQQDRPAFKAWQQLAPTPFTQHNHTKLLINGDEAFPAMFEHIDAAQSYILIQFYIIRDDALGREFQERLIRKAKQGVRVYLLYDEIGCHGLPSAYIEALTRAGVEARPFKTTKGRRNRFQINFRNHRKIMVVDGRVAFVGGLNVGDEYIGRSRRFGPWRDTHVKASGPCVQSVQLSFIEDWHWATMRVPSLDWVPKPAAEGDMSVLVLPTGPADDLDSCALLFIQAINAAKHRLWIATPYFVPDATVINALQLAGLRGVDVRIILPQKADHWLVYLSMFSYLRPAEDAGVKIYRYQPGFLHQKVMLIDHDIAAVGTANLDNRSFRLNFEITMIVANRLFASRVEAMLKADLANSRQARAADLESRWFGFKLAVRLARLLDPVQ